LQESSGAGSGRAKFQKRFEEASTQVMERSYKHSPAENSKNVRKVREGLEGFGQEVA